MPPQGSHVATLPTILNNSFGRQLIDKVENASADVPPDSLGAMRSPTTQRPKRKSAENFEHSPHDFK
jgi:hypothetical protein